MVGLDVINKNMNYIENIYDLDMRYMLLLFFLAAFFWHFLIHHLRFKMLKFYIKRDFKFHHLKYGPVAPYPPAEIAAYQALGLASLGWPTKTSGKFTPWSLVDGLCHLIMFSMPIYLMGQMIAYLFNKYRDIFGSVGAMQNATLEAIIVVISVFLLSALPHFWVIYFNRKRFQYYRSYRLDSQAL